MIRILFTYVLPLLLPSAIYFLWMLPARRRAKAEGREDPFWEKPPWLWLAGIGVLLFGASLAFFGLGEGGPAWSDYEPPRIEDGGIVPGRVGGDPDGG